MRQNLKTILSISFLAIIVVGGLTCLFISSWKVGLLLTGTVLIGTLMAMSIIHLMDRFLE